MKDEQLNKVTFVIGVHISIAQADSKVLDTKQGDTLKRNCFRGECPGKARKTVVARYHALRQAQIH